MTPENALMYRRVVSVDKDRVVIEEKWDLTHPDCPFVRNPWSDLQGPLGNRGYRQVTMTSQEFAEADIPLKAPHIHTAEQETNMTGERKWCELCGCYIYPDDEPETECCYLDCPIAPLPPVRDTGYELGQVLGEALRKQPPPKS